MRGKQAKLLRKIIRGLFPKLPDRLYLRQTIQKKIILNTLSGPKPITVPINVVSLGDCKRKRYQTLKKYYKQGDPIKIFEKKTK